VFHGSGYEYPADPNEYAFRHLKSLVAPAVSPWAHEAESHARGWVREFGLVRSDCAKERFDKTAAGELAARVYASAVSSLKLAAAADWIGWLFFLDDQLDEGHVGRDPAAAHAFLQPLAESLCDKPANWPPVGSPLRAALSDIRRRMLPAMPVAWQGRFTRHVADYLNGCEWEAANRAHGRVPCLDEFPSRRRTAGAIWPSLDLLEFVTDAPLPDRVYGDPLFAEMCEAAADVVCWTDDLLTLDKERACGDVHNLVIVLERATGCTTTVAMMRAAHQIDSRLADFMRCECRLEEMFGRIRADDAVQVAAQKYTAGLRNWMRGHLDWGLHTIRYHSVERTTTGLAPAYLEMLQ
jgi:terpene synthase-like protein